MKLFLLLLSFSAVLFSCNSSPDKKTEETAGVKIDSATAVRTTLDFLKWYDEHAIHLMQIGLVDQTPGHNYFVTMDSCRKLLDELNASGYLTHHFLEEKGKDFQQKKTELEKNPQNEGPPYGFEADPILMSQELDLELDSLPSIKIVSAKVFADSALVDFVLNYEYEFKILKEDGSSRIDRILLVGDM